MAFQLSILLCEYSLQSSSKMYLILWVLGFHSIFYHLLFTIYLLFFFVAYKIYQACKTHSVMSHGRAMLIRAGKRVMPAPRIQASNVAQFATIVILLVAVPPSIECLEQDARLLEPLASVAKSIVNTVTLGSPLEIDLGPSDIAKNLMSISWRTGFPVTMPRGFINKTQDFYNDIRQQVNTTDVSGLKRKRLHELKVDLDNIIDSIVDRVRHSRDGIYTNYLDTQVDGMTLKEACLNVGLQLKAYGVDLTHYRNIAGAVLGVPIIPSVASSVVSAARSVPKGYNSVTGLTTSIVQTPVSQLPGAALGAVSQMSGSAVNTLGSFAQSLPTATGQLFGSSPVLANQPVLA